MRAELKARLSLPPQPNLLSRIPAYLSRRIHFSDSSVSSSYKTKLDNLAISATERFRTGYEGVLNATQKELATRVEPNIPEQKLIPNPDEQITVVIASGNDTKIKEFIRVIADHANFINIPDAVETHTLSSHHDALSKAISAAEIVAKSEDDVRREVKNQPHLTIATDAVNKIPVKRVDDTTGLTQFTYQALGKPNNLRNAQGSELTKDQQEKSVQVMFGELAKMAKDHNLETVPYVIEMSTILYNPKDPANYAHSTQKSSVFLSPEGLSYLATDGGFAHYKDMVAQLDFDITKTAGGFELDALDKMGIVTYITGTEDDLKRRINEKQFPTQRENAKEHSYAIAKGNVDPYLVRKYLSRDEQPALVAI